MQRSGGLTKGEVESDRKQARKRNVDFSSGKSKSI